MATIFTKIVNREIPCHLIAEDDRFMAFLDVMPLVEGHVLVIPKQEVDYIEITGETAIGYKMQWDKKRAIKIPSSFQEAYPAIKVTGVNRSTFWTFIQKK